MRAHAATRRVPLSVYPEITRPTQKYSKLVQHELARGIYEGGKGFCVRLRCNGMAQVQLS